MTLPVPGKMPIVDENIANFGQHLFGVFGEPRFVYTIGNAGWDLPELLLIGPFDPSTVGGVLNQLGFKMRSTGRALDGDISIGGQFPIRIHKVRYPDIARSEYTVQVGQYYGREDYDVLQLLLCDPDGRYPGDPGVDPDFNVPVL